VPNNQLIEQTVRKILQARVYEVAEQTPLTHAPLLSQRLNNSVYIKREDLQPIFSFKLRGAYNKMVALDSVARHRGVIAASAGNHAQGVALSASKLGISALIVMPKTTPAIKVNAVQQLGAQTISHGDSYDEACDYALALADKKNLTFIHPYDDIDVIAGQGTIALEILSQKSGTIDAIFVPVGGGGLIAGIASYIKFVRPEIKIIGVEPDDANSMTQALESGQRVILEQVGLFADGVAVRQAGKETFRIAQQLVDEMICVSTDEICAAIKDIFDETRSITEPAGALAVAGLNQ
jgi:threonine dehydratase